jgi:hypothetical protein
MEKGATTRRTWPRTGTAPISAATGATARIYTTAAVQKAWPQFRDELVRSGSEADVHGLAIDAKLEGYEFGGDRAKRPQKRRVTIERCRGTLIQKYGGAATLAAWARR